jgi:hypothetical protein
MSPVVEKAIDAVCRVTDATPDELIGTSRVKDLVLFRHLVWWAANVIGGKSQSGIARQFGRDHTTVRWGVVHIAKYAQEGGARVVALVEEVTKAMDDPNYRPARIARTQVPARRDPSQPKRKTGPKPKPAPEHLAPTGIVGEHCSEEWWASNDASFRAGLVRAADAARRAAEVSAFTHMGKSARNLRLSDSGSKSVLALPRNLPVGLQRSAPDHSINQEHTQRTASPVA